ncbi:MAG: molecular chaperone [Acidobacteriota bacterium]|nr:molecular chaperone [Acidobacteriota bacterium]
MLKLSNWIVVTIALLGALPKTVAADATPPAQIAVSPSRFEVEIGSKPTTESVDVVNLGDRPVSIQVTVATWDLDERNQVRILEPDEQSLDQWMVVNPLRFTIPAGKSQTVRFSVRPKVRPLPGEHRAMLYFEQVLPEEAATRIRLKFKVGVAVYAFAGDVSREGTLHGVEVVHGQNPARFRFDVSNEGTAHVRLSGDYAVYKADDYDASSKQETATVSVASGTLPSRPVLPGARRHVVLGVDGGRLPPGEYVLDLHGQLGGRSIDRVVPFSIYEPTLQARTEEPAPVPDQE